MDEPVLERNSDQQEGLSKTASLLFVDDERNILSSMKRLFRPLGYNIHLASSGAEGLEILEREDIDLIVSDMRMPEMNGAEFLERAAQQWPNAMRLLLTGYSDLGSTVAAVNKGKIYRYVSKPWEDQELVLAVQHALERKNLEDEKKRLEELTRAQNQELNELNTNLEKKVVARTEELNQAMGFLETAHETLKQQYSTSVKVFAHLIESRGGSLSAHAQRVTEVAKALGEKLNLIDSEIQIIEHAALLHDIGKVALPDALLDQPYGALSSEQREQVDKHVIIGEAVFMGLESLNEVSRLIRSHHERFDGKGYPDKLKGEDIPLGARILAIASDFDSLQMGMLSNKKFTADEARLAILDQRGVRYDPKIVDLFVDYLSKRDKVREQDPDEFTTKSTRLRAGMKLSRDLVAQNGILLLSSGHLLDDVLISKIRGFEKMMDCELLIYVEKK